MEAIFAEKTVMYREEEVVKGKGCGEGEMVMGGRLTFYMIETQGNVCDSKPKPHRRVAHAAHQSV